MKVTKIQVCFFFVVLFGGDIFNWTTQAFNPHFRHKTIAYCFLFLCITVSDSCWTILTTKYEHLKTSALIILFVFSSFAKLSTLERHEAGPHILYGHDFLQSMVSFCTAAMTCRSVLLLDGTNMLFLDTLLAVEILSVVVWNSC